jgi:hypothetical protein
VHSRTGTWFSETFISASAFAEALNVIARTAQLALDLVVILSLADRFLVEAHPLPRAGSPSIDILVSLVNSMSWARWIEIEYFDIETAFS